MDCWECEENPGKRARVAYTDGETGTVQLCARCLDRFEKVDFVAEIQPRSAELETAGSIG